MLASWRRTPAADIGRLSDLSRRGDPHDAGGAIPGERGAASPMGLAAPGMPTMELATREVRAVNPSTDHVIIVGYGLNGRNVARALRRRRHRVRGPGLERTVVRRRGSIANRSSSATARVASARSRRHPAGADLVFCDRIARVTKGGHRRGTPPDPGVTSSAARGTSRNRASCTLAPTRSSLRSSRPRSRSSPACSASTTCLTRRSG